MKLLSRWRLWALIVLMLGVVQTRTAAQLVTITAASSVTNTVTVGTPVYFSLTISNAAGYLLPDVQITNAFSSTIIVSNSYYASQGSLAYATNTTNTLVFTLGNMLYATNVQITYAIFPQVYGPLTNTFSLSTNQVAVDLVGTNVATNYVIQVVSAATDLSVIDTGFGPTGAYSSAYTNIYYVNDWLAYGILVSNAGPNNATGVILTNTLPAGLKLLATTNSSYSVVSNTLLLTVGSLASGSSEQFQLLFQPTNTGLYFLTNTIGSPGLLDGNVANNTAITNLFVTNYIASLQVATNSGQVYDNQNGLVEQYILLTNTNSVTAPAVRVVVTGLTNILFNAVATNAYNGTNGSPLVTGPGSLAPNQSVQLMLQYNVTNRTAFAFTNGQLHAYAVYEPILAPPATIGTKTNANIIQLVRISNGRMLVEFGATIGTNYAIVYADNVTFSNAMLAQPLIKAPANHTQWIDYGPPGTVSSPTNAPQRYYRVIANP